MLWVACEIVEAYQEYWKHENGWTGNNRYTEAKRRIIHCYRMQKMNQVYGILDEMEMEHQQTRAISTEKFSRRISDVLDEGKGKSKILEV